MPNVLEMVWSVKTHTVPGSTVTLGVRPEHMRIAGVADGLRIDATVEHYGRIDIAVFNAGGVANTSMVADRLIATVRDLIGGKT